MLGSERTGTGSNRTAQDPGGSGAGGGGAGGASQVSTFEQDRLRLAAAAIGTRDVNSRWYRLYEGVESENCLCIDTTARASLPTCQVNLNAVAGGETLFTNASGNRIFRRAIPLRDSMDEGGTVNRTLANGIPEVCNPSTQSFSMAVRYGFPGAPAGTQDTYLMCLMAAGNEFTNQLSLVCRGADAKLWLRISSTATGLLDLPMNNLAPPDFANSHIYQLNSIANVGLFLYIDDVLRWTENDIEQVPALPCYMTRGADAGASGGNHLGLWNDAWWGVNASPTP